MILVVGEAVVDVDIGNEPPKVRLGGVLHACRALWAADVEYALAYIAPRYLAESIERYAAHHGAGASLQFGEVSGSPSVMLIHRVQETASQGYELLLRDQYSVVLNPENITNLSAMAITDTLVFAGQYDIGAVLDVVESLDTEVHIDCTNSDAGLSFLDGRESPISTLISSTSDEFFLQDCGGIPETYFRKCFGGGTANVLFKENRGGSRLVGSTGVEIEVGAQNRQIQHSVGVGDVFNAIYIGCKRTRGTNAALAYASWVAGEYADTTYPDDFKRETKRCLAISEEDITQIAGVRFPWEDRRSKHIYIAGPDFDYSDRRAFDELAESLSYHNFSPRRPILEHGQANHEMTRTEKARLSQQDISLLQSCQLVVAVCEQDDPGTLVEVGLAYAMGIPVIILDPHYRVDNPMLIGTSRSICHSLDSVLCAVFSILGTRVGVK